MIEVKELRKQFNGLTAVDGVSLSAQPGKIFGLLGPNGAGKSTTINCIAGLITPTSGHVSVLGHDVVSQRMKARAGLGVVPQELALYEDLSARENLRFWGGAYGLRGKALEAQVNRVLEDISLLDRAGDKPETFSGGMKRRLNFGCGVVHQPKVLLLDEPTVGVDPQSRERLLQMVRHQVDNGCCVLYTTHYMEEAESLCDEIAIIDHGCIIASGTMDALRTQMGERDLLRVTGHFDVAAVSAALDNLDDIEVHQVEEEVVSLSALNASRRLPDFIQAVTAANGSIQETTLTRPNLEALFLTLTGKELRA